MNRIGQIISRKSPVPTGTPARLMLPKVIFVVATDAVARLDLIRRIVSREQVNESSARGCLFENIRLSNEKSEPGSNPAPENCKQLFYEPEKVATKRLTTDWLDWLNAVRVSPQSKQIVGADDLPQILSEPDDQRKIKMPGYSALLSQRAAERFVTLLTADYATRVELVLGIPHVGYALALAGIGNIWRRESELLRLIKTGSLAHFSSELALNVSDELSENIYSHGTRFIFSAKSISFVFSSRSVLQECKNYELFTDPGDLGEIQAEDFIHFNPLMKRWSVKRGSESFHISDTADRLDR